MVRLPSFIFLARRPNYLAGVDETYSLSLGPLQPIDAKNGFFSQKVERICFMILCSDIPSLLIVGYRINDTFLPCGAGSGPVHLFAPGVNIVL